MVNKDLIALYNAYREHLGSQQTEAAATMVLAHMVQGGANALRADLATLLTPPAKPKKGEKL